MKRTIALMLSLLVALPWAALPAGAGSACAPAGNDAMAACSSCTAGGSAPESSLRPGCCRFTPRSEAAPLQATSVSPTPKPHHFPDSPAAVLAPVAVDRPHDPVVSSVRIGSPPAPHAPPTETTHLLI